MKHKHFRFEISFSEEPELLSALRAPAQAGWRFGRADSGF